MNRALGKRVVLALALVDVLFFGGWIVREESLRRGSPIHLPVEGYDPRDLLSGHYVRFQLVAVREAENFIQPRGTISPQTFCIEARDGLYHVTGLRMDNANSCFRFLRATFDERGHWDFGVDRFYVDERLANEVRWIQANPSTYLVAVVDEGGVIHPTDLVVNGKSFASKAVPH